MPSKKDRKGKHLQVIDEEGPRSIRDNTIHPTCIIAEEDLKEFASAGQGFYATVKVGEWTRPNNKKERVAIKCVKEDVVQDHLDEILKEAKNMAKLEHKNIIKLFGICVVEGEITCKVKLVTEYAPFGSLIKVLRDQDQDSEHRSFFRQITRLWQYACQIAEGMQYLHSKNMIHLDLAARNVLVVGPNLVRISDFGLAKVLRHDRKIPLEKQMAIAWCAPELIKIQLVTKGCDVWSYGVVLWEMFSFGQKPWSDITHPQIIQQADNPYIRLHQPEPCSSAIYELMTRCWSQSPGDRPGFAKITNILNEAKPRVASAKTGFWTANAKELHFQKGMKITIIDSYGGDKYLAQNENAEIGFVPHERLNFDAKPNEKTFVMLKPRISRPFDMRHTTKEISKELNSTGVFPVEVSRAVGLASPSPGNDPEPPLLQADQDEYVTMVGGNQDVDKYQEEAKNYNQSKHHSTPPPIPERTDLTATQMPSSNFQTLPANGVPVPKPRKLRQLSGRDQTQMQQLPQESQWVNHCIDSRPTVDEKESAFISSAPASGESLIASEYPVDHMQDGRTRSLARKEKFLPMNGNEQSAQSRAPNGELTKSDSPDKDLIDFDGDIELQATATSQEDNPPPLPINTSRFKSDRVSPKQHNSTSNTAYPINPRPLTYPSSSQLYDLPDCQHPIYCVPFPNPLPRLPEKDPNIFLQPPANTVTTTANSRSRTRSESSVEKENAYGEEINQGIERIHQLFPNISKDACYARILEYKGEIDRVLKVLKVCDVTKMEEKAAQFHLGHCQWDVERTINYIIENRNNVP